MCVWIIYFCLGGKWLKEIQKMLILLVPEWPSIGKWRDGLPDSVPPCNFPSTGSLCHFHGWGKRAKLIFLRRKEKNISQSQFALTDCRQVISILSGEYRGSELNLYFFGVLKDQMDMKQRTSDRRFWISNRGSNGKELKDKPNDLESLSCNSYLWL